jgi:TatA/E family protein of Tat protein translocase
MERECAMAYLPQHGIRRWSGLYYDVTPEVARVPRNGAMKMGEHWLQLAILLLIGMVFFGAKRLPEMGSAVGKTIREFQRSMREVTDSPAAPPPAVTQPVDHAQLAAPTAASLATPTALQQPATPPVEAVRE